MEKSFGLVYSQRVLLALVEAGHPPRRRLQGRAAQRHEGLGGEDPVRRPAQGRPGSDRPAFAAQIEALFDPSYALRNMGVIFERVAALEW